MPAFLLPSRAQKRLSGDADLDFLVLVSGLGNAGASGLWVGNDLDFLDFRMGNCLLPGDCQFKRAPTPAEGSSEGKQPIVNEDEPRTSTNRHEDPCPVKPVCCIRKHG